VFTMPKTGEKEKRISLYFTVFILLFVCSFFCAHRVSAQDRYFYCSVLASGPMVDGECNYSGSRRPLWFPLDENGSHWGGGVSIVGANLESCLEYPEEKAAPGNVAGFSLQCTMSVVRVCSKETPGNEMNSRPANYKECPIYITQEGTAGTQTEPVRVELGQRVVNTFKFKIYATDGNGYTMDKFSLSCRNCQTGIEVKAVGTDSLEVTFDSVGPRIVVGLNMIEVVATPESRGVPSIIPLYFIVAIDCDGQIKDIQSQCSTDQSQPTQLACEQKCTANKYCRYISGQCLFEGDLTTQEQAQLGESAVSKYVQAKYTKPSGYVGPLPDCAFSGTCRRLVDLLKLFINYARGMFAVVAGIAFFFFVYGGFMIIISFGNAEKVKKGQQILIGAVVGLIIVFSAYLIVNFILEALNVSSDFRGI